jgi:hypothetical protein
MALVPLDTYSSVAEANLVKARLASAGIEAVVRSDDLGAMTPTMVTVRGVQVLVNDLDEADARAVLED